MTSHHSDVEFTKIKDHTYLLSFDLTSNTFDISQLLTFDLVHLLYRLNATLFQTIDIQITPDYTECCIFTIFKHILEDFGLPQRFSNTKITRHQLSPTHIQFVSKTQPTIEPQYLHLLSQDMELVKIDNAVVDCVIQSSQHVSISCTLVFSMDMEIPEFVEKILSNIIKTLFRRLRTNIAQCS